jgi:hypothetical protein
MEYVIIEFLKFLMPMIMLVVLIWLVVRMFFKRDEKNRRMDLEATDRKNLVTLKVENGKMITPVRLQAYERAILLMERITPENLVMRMRKPGTGAGEMQGLLLQGIRDEYDHNMSQQLYVSDEAWEMVKKAKEEVIQLINNAGADVREGENGIDLCRHILERAAQMDTSPTALAIKGLKSEIKKLF